VIFVPCGLVAIRLAKSLLETISNTTFLTEEVCHRKTIDFYCSRYKLDIHDYYIETLIDVHKLKSYNFYVILISFFFFFLSISIRSTNATRSSFLTKHYSNAH